MSRKWIVGSASIFISEGGSNNFDRKSCSFSTFSSGRNSNLKMQDKKSTQEWKIIVSESVYLWQESWNTQTCDGAAPLSRLWSSIFTTVSPRRLPHSEVGRLFTIHSVGYDPDTCVAHPTPSGAFAQYCLCQSYFCHFVKNYNFWKNERCKRPKYSI